MAITHVKGEFFAPEHAATHRAFGFHGSVAKLDDGGTYVGRAARKRLAEGGAAEKPEPHTYPQDDTGGAPVFGPDWDDEPDRRAAEEARMNARPKSRKGYQFGGMVDGAPSERPAMAPAPQAQAAGALSRATLSMPIADAAQAMTGVARAGKVAGARQAVAALANAARRRQSMPAPGVDAIGATPPPAPAQQDIPAMAKGGFINKAVRHPGRMQHAAARAGESTHAYMEQHQHDPGSLGSAARLGLRLTGGDLSPRHRKKG